jgi:hypothetical protein
MKQSGSNFEVNTIVNRIISTSSKLLKVVMSYPDSDESRVAFNNLHTLRWALDSMEKFSDVENFEQKECDYLAIIKFIDDVDNYANRILVNFAEQEAHYLKILNGANDD